jgi:hypothetical protein
MCSLWDKTDEFGQKPETINMGNSHISPAQQGHIIHPLLIRGYFVHADEPAERAK